jgi:hypothetical protein
MSEIPDPIGSKIDEVFESITDDPRPYLGPSQSGEPCERRTWLSFRWAVRKTFPGRMLRLFRRGQREEDTVVSMLKMIGMEVTDEQKNIEFGGHIWGHIDGVVNNAVLEIKTHNLKSFDNLIKNGVKSSKPQHYAQMQLYMLGLKMNRALYFAVCKDDDRIHTERIELDKEYAEKELNRLKRITLKEHIPAPISTDPSWYQCKFCEAHDICHGSKLTREINCRTCAHSTPLGSGQWHCIRWGAIIPTDAQRNGCPSHTFHPDLVPWKLIESKGTEWAGFYDGVGLIGEGGLDSKSVKTDL